MLKRYRHDDVAPTASRKAAGRLTALSLIACVAAGLPSVAIATPTVTFQARVLPIPVNLSQAHSRTYPHTGVLGAGAVIEAAYSIRGTEYGLGTPTPLKRVVLYLPAGTRLHPEGFTACPSRLVDRGEFARCPARSVASPEGSFRYTTILGGTRLEETARFHAYFAGHGQLTFIGPLLRLLGGDRFSGSVTTAPEGPVLTADLPLIPELPGAPYASPEAVTIKFGTAFTQRKRLVSYLTLPPRCPAGGFVFSADLTFGASPGPTGEAVTVRTSVPCPRGR